MKNKNYNNIFITIALAVDFVLIISAIWNYYFFDHVTFVIILFIVWLILTITSLLLLFFNHNQTKSMISIFFINLISIVLVFTIGDIIDITSVKATELPKVFELSKFENSPTIYYSKNKEYFLVQTFKDSEMAFGSGHTYLGLYDESKQLIDECKLGEFPIELESWDRSQIKLLLTIWSTSNDKEYINSWIIKCPKLGEFDLVYSFKYKK